TADQLQAIRVVGNLRQASTRPPSPGHWRRQGYNSGSTTSSGRSIRRMRLVGERRAMAALVLAFFTLQYLLAGLFDDRLHELRYVLIALGAAYGCGFWGVVSCWFWARWYSLGLAFSGMAMACIAAWQAGGFFLELYILGGSHLALGIGLMGT